MAVVWKSVVSQMADINRLGKTFDVPSSGHQPIQIRHALIFDNGHLRPIGDQDRTLEPNHYTTILYEQDLVDKTWRVELLDNQWFQRPVGYAYYDDGNIINVTFEYDHDFEGGYIAKSARAYRNDTLIANAKAVKKLTSTMPFQVEIQEMYVDADGKTGYEGHVVFELGGGRVVKRESTSGHTESYVQYVGFR